MSDYPKPPFDTTTTWIEDTFDPELGPIETTVDLNDMPTEQLLKYVATNDIAFKIVVFRATQEDQKN